MNEQQMQFSYDRRRTSTLTLDEQPGAHTGATRKYIPGYADSNIVFLNTSTGNDANTGASIAQALLTYSAAATAAGTTKKIRLVNSATLSDNITKPTEATIGTTSTIASSFLTDPINSLTGSTTDGWTGGRPVRVTWSPKLSKWYGVSTTEIVSSPDGDTWTVEETLSGTVGQRIWWDENNQRLYILGTAGVLLYSTNGSDYTTLTIGSESLGALVYADDLGMYVLGGGTKIWNSTDGINFESVTIDTDNGISSGVYADGKFIFFNGNGEQFLSTNGVSWAKTNPLNGYEVQAVAYMNNVGLFIAIDVDGEIWSTPDGGTWTSRRSATTIPCYDITYIKETGYAVVCEGRVLTRSVNGTAWASSAALAAYGASEEIRGVSYSPLKGRIVTVGGQSTSTQINAYGPLYATTISAAVAGFSIQAVQYSGTVTAYNCTLRQPGTTEALSLDACRVEYDSHISNNAVTSRATLYRGDRHLTCTPSSQNAIDLNLDTWGGTFYIYNASQTGYERIRDCLGNGPIVANYPVTVGGRANVEGTSVNVLFDAEVTHNDPRFVDETDYKLEFQTNGYTRNSFAAARSNIYFNSAGDARDIGAWSYVESAVSYYYAKTEVMYKGEISHGLEFALNEQQGDSGVVSVYGNTRRVKEVITITYGTTYDREKAIFEYMLTLQDKGVKIQLDAEWNDNAGTVVVNGNQAAGVEFLTVDSTTYYEGMWLTISGEQYWIMRASPSPSAATKLILDRPLEDAVLDNDVIVRNYPAGAGEYQFSGPMNLTMKRVHPTALQGYYSGFQIRLVRKKQ